MRTEKTRLRVLVLVLALVAIGQLVLVRKRDSAHAVVPMRTVRIGDTISEFGVSFAGRVERATALVTRDSPQRTRQCRVLVFFTPGCVGMKDFGLSWRTGAAPGAIPEMWITLATLIDSTEVHAIAPNVRIAQLSEQAVIRRLGIDVVPVALLLDANNVVVGFPRQRPSLEQCSEIASR